LTSRGAGLTVVHDPIGVVEIDAMVTIGEYMNVVVLNLLKV